MPVPVFNTAYTFFISLADATDPSSFLAGPTIAAGDFQISLDGAAFVNLTNLPVVLPSGSITVQITLTAAEMNGQKVNVKAIDVAGDQWQDLLMAIDVPTGSSETVHNIQEGDIVESSTKFRVNQKGTTTALVDKDITGSLLSTGVSVQTTEAI